MKAVVTANKGYKSVEMTVEEAVRFAYRLEQLGNYNVAVIPA